MNIDKLETDGKISKVKLLHDCAGTLRTAAGFAGHKCNGDIV